MKMCINYLTIILFSISIVFSSCKKGDEPEPIISEPIKNIIDSLKENNIYIGEFKEVSSIDTSVASMWYTFTKDSSFQSYAYSYDPGTSTYTYYTINDKAGITGSEVKWLNDSSFVTRKMNIGGYYDNVHYILISNDSNKVFTFTRYYYSGNIISSPNSSNTNYNNMVTFVKL